MGRIRIPPLVFTLTLLTHPSLLGKVSMIRAKGHAFREQVSSTRRTISPMLKFLRSWCHFDLIWRSGRYSFDQRFQNWSAKYWTWRHLLFEYIFSFRKTPGVRGTSDLSSSRWLGVKASRSFGSSETCVIGRLLMIDSTSMRRVERPSSSRICWLRIALRTFRTVLIHLSHVSPWWDPVGG